MYSANPVEKTVIRKLYKSARKLYGAGDSHQPAQCGHVQLPMPGEDDCATGALHGVWNGHRRGK